MLLIPRESKANIIKEHFSASNTLFLQAEKIMEDDNLSCICSRIKGVNHGKKAVFFQLIEAVGYFFKSVLSCTGSLVRWKVDEIHEHFSGVYYSMLIFSETIFLLFKVIGSLFAPNLIKGIGTKMITMEELKGQNQILISEIEETLENNKRLSLEVANLKKEEKYQILVKKYQEVGRVSLENINIYRDKISMGVYPYLNEMYQSVIEKYEKILSLKEEIFPKYIGLASEGVELTKGDLEGESCLDAQEAIREKSVLRLLREISILKRKCTVEEEELAVSQESSSSGAEELESEERSPVGETKISNSSRNESDLSVENY